MLRLHARNPVLLTIASAVIVVSAFAVMAPRFTSNGGPMGENGELQRVSITKSVMIAPPSSSYRAAVSSRPSLAEPEIAKTATIELLVSNVDGVAATIAQLARSAGGDVFALQAQNASADMTLRVPSREFDRLMTRLATLGTVRSRGVKAEDLSASITDSSARLRNLRRTEADILKIMDRSGSVSQIMDVENQLSSVREQIETLQSDVASMRGRVSYATVDITLQAEAQSAPAEPNALAQLKNAFVAATHSVADATVALLAGIIWLLVWVPYLALFGAAIWALRVGLRKYAVRR